MSNRTVVIFTILAFVLGGIFYLLYPTPNEYQAPNPKDSGNSKIVCTQEAKQCPDGSYVGREGPTCEFKACPIPQGVMMEDGTI